MASFAERAYSLVCRIPRGKVATYKLIAKKLGTRAYKAVGNALRANPRPIAIPCHRVVRSDGAVGGYFGNRKSKKKMMLLRKEGIPIRNGKVEHIGDFLWKG